MKNRNIILVSGIILIVALLRLVPGLNNFNPFASIALFGAAYLSKKHLAYIIPLIAIYFSDFILNNTILRSFYPDAEGLIFFSSYMLGVYFSYALIILLGTRLLNKITGVRVLMGALGATGIFFLVTNFGAWASPISIYPQNFGGLMSSYIAGLPFLQATLASNLLFSIILFGSFEIANQFYGQKTAISN
jgi:hypothetical protein